MFTMVKKRGQSRRSSKKEPDLYHKHMEEGISYGRKAERSRKSDPADAFELYHQSIEAFEDALNERPNDKLVQNRIDRYSSQLNELPKPKPNDEGNLEQTILSITLVASFIFGIDLLSHKFTGNVIGSGNTPVDLSVGLLLLIASLIGIFFLLKNKNPKPIPHPERKKK